MSRVKNRRRGYTHLSAKHQVTLPIRVVEELGLRPGDEMRVEAEDGRVVLERTSGPAQRRQQAIDDAAGSLTGVFGPGYLEALRDEWLS